MGCAASTNIPFPDPDLRTPYRQWKATALVWSDRTVWFDDRCRVYALDV